MLVQNLATGVRRLLINFYQRTGKKKPERIIYFRDGVSEGQFNAVQRTELPQIVSCCRQLGMASGEDYTPPVSTSSSSSSSSSASKKEVIIHRQLELRSQKLKTGVRADADPACCLRFACNGRGGAPKKQDWVG